LLDFELAKDIGGRKQPGEEGDDKNGDGLIFREPPYLGLGAAVVAAIDWFVSLHRLFLSDLQEQISKTPQLAEILFLKLQ
jgi:hypothetical protein